jgi:adenosylmethionine-8-amino-7-oxononanoate aminotransferase
MVPLGAMIAREDMAEAFYGLPEEDVQFAHGHTFAGNPLASAVGIAVLDEIVENQLTDKAQCLGEYLVEKLQNLLSFGVIREIRGKGILRGIELVRDTQTMEPFPELGAALKTCALNNGLILRVDPSWFAVAPPLIAEKSDIDEMYERIEKSLTDALKMVAT